MDGEHTYLQINAPTIVSIWICLGLGWGLLVLSSILYKKMGGKANG